MVISDHAPVDPIRLGGAIRAVRIRLRLRQLDVAQKSGLSRSTVSRIERGEMGSLSIDAVLSVARALGMRIDLVPRWRGGELNRLLSAGHSALHEYPSRAFARLHEWLVAPEVTFSVFGERGVIDVLAYHPRRRALLVVELKTQLVDVQGLLGQIDRYRRLARRIARDRGWVGDAVSARYPRTSGWTFEHASPASLP